MKKKILICGATGFIGRNCAEYFAKNDQYEVFGTFLNSEPYSHPHVKMLKADLTRKDFVDTVVKGMDIVIQAAATTSGSKDTIQRPYYHVTDNAIMNSLIFRAAFQHKVSQVIFFSCTTMYRSSDVPLKETDFDASQEIPASYFGVGWTKVYIEKMCEFYSRLGSTRFTAIRHSNIYGPYDKFDLERSHVFGATMTKVMMANPGGTINVWGSGEERRDLLYVSDLVQFVQAALQKQATPFELLNCGCGCAVSIKELVEKIIQASGKELRIAHDLSKPTIKTQYCVDCSQAKEKFDWTPRVSLEEGIQKTMQWCKENVKSEALAVL